MNNSYSDPAERLSPTSTFALKERGCHLSRAVLELFLRFCVLIAPPHELSHTLALTTFSSSFTSFLNALRSFLCSSAIRRPILLRKPLQKHSRAFVQVDPVVFWVASQSAEPPHNSHDRSVRILVCFRSDIPSLESLSTQ